MKQTYIIKKEGNSGLVLFFSGWGSESKMFGYPVPEGYDYMLCHDYTEPGFDYATLEGYSHIRLLAWSMGVWVAGKVFEGRSMPWEMRIAVNGTMFPIDDSKGIPSVIFEGTLAAMSPATLAKFRRRMCDGAYGLSTFMAHGPERSAEDLKAELQAIRDAVLAAPVPCFSWDKAIIGLRDRIFPPENQKVAHSGIPIEETDSAHYDEQLFMSCLNGEHVIWTRN